MLKQIVAGNMLDSIKQKISNFRATSRIYLFFPAIILKLLASAISAVAFVQGMGVFWIIGMVLWFFWIILLIFIALPKTDAWLRRFKNSLRASALLVIVILGVSGLLELAGVFSIGLTNIQANILGPDTQELLGALNHSFAYNDATALCHQAADNARNGLNPYAAANVVLANLRFGNPFDKTTPLRAGRFADDFPYPAMAELDAVWSDAVRNPTVIPLEIESHLAYPAGCFLIPMPFLAIGISDLRIIYLILLIPALVHCVIKSPGNLRWWLIAGVAGSIEILNSIASGETGIVSIPFLLMAWVFWRRNIWAAAICLGLAVAGKQIAWFFVPFFLILVLRNQGFKQAFLTAIITGAVFFSLNLPYLRQDPRLWAASMLAPMNPNFFPLGVGMVSLVSGGYWNVSNPLLFGFLEGMVGVGCLRVYYFVCLRAPHLGLVLAVVPLLFAWRSLWSYFFYFDVILFIAIVLSEYGDQGSERKNFSTVVLNRIH